MMCSNKVNNNINNKIITNIDFSVCIDYKAPLRTVHMLHYYLQSLQHPYMDCTTITFLSLISSLRSREDEMSSLNTFM